jgi:phosphatidylserine/phosphatidylglycerophosphate/cardiolipin synthase-like enzyme
MSLNRIFVVTLLLLPFNLFSQVISIAEARALGPGNVVTVRGIVTNSGELGKIRYLQDGTAGIAAFAGTGSMAGFDAAVKAGDSVQISGTLISFQGLLEINPVSNWQIIGSGYTLPPALPVSLLQLSDDMESRLVRVDCAFFEDAGGVFQNSGEYPLEDAAGNPGVVYLRSGHPLQGSAIPTATVQFTGILSDYNGYQLLPRTPADLVPSACLHFTEEPDQSNILTNGFTVSWATGLPASAKILYDTTPVALQQVLDIPAVSTTHSHTLGNLLPGRIYWVQVRALHNGEEVASTTRPFATRSLSSGQIKVYFNHEIDPLVAGNEVPDGQSFAAVRDETIARIDSARHSIDVAMYNNNRNDITAALKAAQARGVRVRYIAALDAANNALDPAPGFPVLYGNDEAIMHDKFMIVDADYYDRCWVMSGSLNWTTGNMANDYNNTLFIQDQSLARAYELEFEEMWGGGGALPVPANSRFGADKTDNTPHRFIVGDVPMECRFSPSDGTTARIADAIRGAGDEALFALFSYTKEEQTQALLDVRDAGASVRGMIENIDDPGAEYDYLLSQNIEVLYHAASGDLHHKYAVLDAAGADPAVVTGSHNWSLAAETANDENTLIIRDARIARLFKAEFEQRWSELTTATRTPAPEAPALSPNPAGEVLRLRFDAPAMRQVTVYNAPGMPVLRLPAQNISGIDLPVGHLPPGFYFVRVGSENGHTSVPFQKI